MGRGGGGKRERLICCVFGGLKVIVAVGKVGEGWGREREEEREEKC